MRPVAYLVLGAVIGLDEVADKMAGAVEDVHEVGAGQQHVFEFGMVEADACIQHGHGNGLVASAEPVCLIQVDGLARGPVSLPAHLGDAG